jgi:hypothetical protein
MTALRAYLDRHLACIPNPFLRGMARGMLYGYAIGAGYLTAAAVAIVLEWAGWVK